MPPAARVGDPTGHPGTIAGPGVATVLHRRPAGRRGRRHAHLLVAAARRPAPADAVPAGQSTTVLIGGRPALRLGDIAGCGAPIVVGCADRGDRRMTCADRQAFLGRGWAFPVAADADGEVALADYDEDVRQAVRIILGTDHGERVMRPDFGAGLRRFVFEPIDTHDARARRATASSRRSCRGSRGSTSSCVGARPGRPTASRARRRVDYRVRATNTFYNLVYPFYLLEGGGRRRERAPSSSRATPTRCSTALRAPAAGATCRGWQPAPGGAGAALLPIYARYLHALAERIDQAPDKNELAFLDLLGVDLLPAQAARAPVVFTTASGRRRRPRAGGTRLGAKRPRPQPAARVRDRARASRSPRRRWPRS